MAWWNRQQPVSLYNNNVEMAIGKGLCKMWARAIFRILEERASTITDDSVVSRGHIIFGSFCSLILGSFFFFFCACVAHSFVPHNFFARANVDGKMLSFPRPNVGRHFCGPANTYFNLNETKTHSISQARRTHRKNSFVFEFRFFTLHDYSTFCTMRNTACEL